LGLGSRSVGTCTVRAGTVCWTVGSRSVGGTVSRRTRTVCRCAVAAGRRMSSDRVPACSSVSACGEVTVSPDACVPGAVPAYAGVPSVAVAADPESSVSMSVPVRSTQGGANDDKGKADGSAHPVKLSDYRQWWHVFNLTINSYVRSDPKIPLFRSALTNCCIGHLYCLPGSL
jgi:hypothetical protein